jgi:hypothetical protein
MKYHSQDCRIQAKPETEYLSKRSIGHYRYTRLLGDFSASLSTRRNVIRILTNIPDIVMERGKGMPAGNTPIILVKNVHKSYILKYKNADRLIRSDWIFRIG